MYKVMIINGDTNKYIHYPYPDKNAPHLLKAELQQILGQVHNLSFSIPYNNQGYNDIYDLVTKVQVINIKSGVVIFEGRVYTSKVFMSSNGEFYKEVIAESELAYLNDTRVRAWDLQGLGVGEFITQVINNHNTHTTADKQFTVGNIEVIGNITTKTKFENSLNILMDKMVNTLGVGYLIVRKQDGIRYLDYLPQLTGTSPDIVLAKNMKDMSFLKDLSNIATRLIPVGKDGLTIASVNNGVDYLENSTAVNTYGIIEQIIEFQDIEDPTQLMQASQEKLSTLSNPIYKLDTNVLDLSTIGIDSSTFIIGTDTNISNEAINFNENFTIIEKDVDLLSPQNCKITLNEKFESLTDRQISLQRVAQYVEKILTADKQVNTFYLDGYINLLQNQMKAMADTAEKQQALCILFEDRVQGSGTFGATALGTKGIMISDTLDESGNWVFRTFGTGKGFTADLIVAGILLGGKVKFDLNQGTLLIGTDESHYSLYFDGTDLHLVGNNYSFDGQTFTFGNADDNVQHTDEYSMYKHSDGSYTKLSYDGMERYVSETGHTYHYLSYVGVAIIPDDQDWISIQLPDEFKNKQFSVIAQAAALQNLTEGYALKTYNVGCDTFDYANATFHITGTCIATLISNPATAPKIDFAITFMAIA